MPCEGAGVMISARVPNRGGQGVRSPMETSAQKGGLPVPHSQARGSVLRLKGAVCVWGSCGLSNPCSTQHCDCVSRLRRIESVTRQVS